MEHNAIKEQLFAFYDGELSPAVRQEVESHLSICEECRDQDMYDAINMLVSTIAQ